MEKNERQEHGEKQKEEQQKEKIQETVREEEEPIGEKVKQKEEVEELQENVEQEEQQQQKECRGTSLKGAEGGGSESKEEQLHWHGEPRLGQALGLDSSRSP